MKAKLLNFVMAIAIVAPAEDLIAGGFTGAAASVSRGSAGYSNPGGSYGNTNTGIGSYGNTNTGTGSYGNTNTGIGSYGNPGNGTGGWGNFGVGGYYMGGTNFGPSLGSPAVYPFNTPNPGNSFNQRPSVGYSRSNSSNNRGSSMHGMKPNMPSSTRRPSSSSGASRITRDIPKSGDASGQMNKRPSPGQIDDFLGFPSSSKRPGASIGSTPTKQYKPLTIPRHSSNTKDNAAVKRPTQRPSFPGEMSKPFPGKPNANTRPVQVDKIAPREPLPTKRPSWATSVSKPGAVNDRWQGQVNTLQKWTKDNPNRHNHWHNWGDNVRHKWRWHHHHNNWFVGDWWYHHNHAVSPWHYYYQFNSYPWGYWWTYPTWPTVGTWFSWNVPANYWATPIFYDYGVGGNVVYQGNVVYIDGKQVGSAAEFAQSAAALAEFVPPANASPEQAEWLPLGTFAVSTDESDVNPTRVMQLAVDRNGIVAGTLYNIQSDQTQSLQGRVDRETQRVAIQFGDAPNVIAETGLYNLTQDAAPMLVHYGTERVETFNLIRLAALEDN